MWTAVIGGGLCVLLLLAGLGYWLYGSQGNGDKRGTFMPGVTVAGVMEKVKVEGFTCLAPGATVARCSKPVKEVEFSVTLQFADEGRVSSIVANGGTGVHSEVKVTELELRPFFEMAAQLPFGPSSPEAKAWVGNNLRKDGRTQLAGVTYETVNSQDLLSMYTKKPS
jgi:hypothetical protein